MAKQALLVAGVMYSPNLGDGIIYDCIRNYARRIDKHKEVLAIDLAGRVGFREDSPSNIFTAHTTAALERYAPRLAVALTKYTIKRKLQQGLLPVWRVQLAQSAGLLVGGGQLFADVRLSFPLRISALANEADEHGMPIAIYGVGVSKHWTPEALQLFSRILQSKNLRYLAVRGEDSKTNLSRHLRKLGLISSEAIGVHPDPAVLASDTYGGSAPRQPSNNTRVGLCVTHPAVLRRHSDKKACFGDQKLREGYIALVRKLVDSGFEVVLFTNGEALDETFLRVIAALSSRIKDSEKIILRHRPQEPRVLVDTIAQCDVVIAHRLHANIVSFSYKRPYIGLTWDSKLEEFFTLTDRENYLCDGTLSEPSAIIRKVNQAMSDPIRESIYDDVCEKARQGISCAITAISA